MKSFNFLRGYDLEYEIIDLSTRQLASWIWVNHPPPNYELFSVTTNGIIEFLERFESTEVIHVVSIYCPRLNILHQGFSEEPNGWGFNIQTERITIEFYYPLNE